ncbi:hypothetical protein HDU93_008872 [Gonapodya sp. JEL0774]|nr:hypothetical protein HDU93_008872 [Gonapodya sp. JEL0774]
MVGDVAGALLALGLKNCVAGFDVINEPFLINAAFYEASYATILASGWTDPIMVVEPAFKNNVVQRPNIPNVVYGPHWYDFRFIMDETYIQLTYAFPSGGVLSALAAFVNGPSSTTGSALSKQLDSVGISVRKLNDWLSSVTAVSTFVASIPTISSSVASYQSTITALISANTPDTLSAFNTDVTNWANTLNGQLFDTTTGIFTVLSPLLTAQDLNTDQPVTSMISASSPLGTVPVIIGEFGCDGAAKFIDCPSWVWSMMSSSDAQLAAGWAQWTYVPQWTPTLVDNFNMEDLSITTGQQGGWNYRAGATVGRPHVLAVAGTPVSVTVIRTPISLTLAYTTGGNNGSTATEIFFDSKAACGAGKSATITATPSGVTCSTKSGNANVVVCDGGRVSSGTAASVTVTC